MPRNFTDNPGDLIKQVFTQIHEEAMSGLPFINPALCVNTIGFDLYEGDWLGVLVAPWTLNLLLLPGPDRQWQGYRVGDKLGIKLSTGDYTFMAGEHEALGQYLTFSLSSPVSQFKSQSEIEQLAVDTRRLISAIPVQDVSDASRRELLTKYIQ